jgi:hypothetical protein
MAVWPNVTFCVRSPALAHTRRSPLGTGARTLSLEPTGGPGVRVTDCVFGPGGVLPCPAQRWPDGRGMAPGEDSGSVNSRPRDEPISLSAPICCLKIGSQNRTLPLPESDKTDRSKQHNHESGR